MRCFNDASVDNGAVGNRGRADSLAVVGLKDRAAGRDAGQSRWEVCDEELGALVDLEQLGENVVVLDGRDVLVRAARPAVRAARQPKLLEADASARGVLPRAVADCVAKLPNRLPLRRVLKDSDDR